MKATTQRSIKYLLLLVMILTFMVSNAVRKIRFEPLADSDFILTIQNIIQTAPNKFEFDVYLLNSNSVQNFELAGIQLGFMFNSLIYTGGNVSVSYNNKDSGLNTSELFTNMTSPVSSVAGYPNQTLVRLSAPAPVDAGSGTIISSSGSGTLVTHLVILSSVNFTSNCTPDLIFNANTVSNPLYPTRVAEFINGLYTQLTVSPGVNALVIGNPTLNPTLPSPPTAFAVTGSGAYCSGTGGLPVGLEGSEAGVTYTLYDVNNIALMPTVEGTGNAITFGNKLSGTFTISGTNVNGSTAMTGSAVITENPVEAASVSIEPSANPVNAGVLVTFTATPSGGGTNPIYQWYNGDDLVGTNTNTYSYTPVDDDIISVTMLSNAPCVTGNPAISNPVRMSVSLGTSLDQNKISPDVYSMDKNIIVNCLQNAKQILIYNTLGSMVMMENNVSGLKKFNLSNYPFEYYFVRVVTDFNVYTRKILLK